ncbi:hypothetical protein ACWEPI_18985 [Streptomyces sp. NPDC004262]
MSAPPRPGLPRRNQYAAPSAVHELLEALAQFRIRRHLLIARAHLMVRDL